MHLTLIFRPGFHVKYLGSFNTGKHGDVKQIDNAMRIVLFKSHGSHCPALFEVQEIGIKVTENATGKVCDPDTRNTTSDSVDYLNAVRFCLTTAYLGLHQLINNLSYSSGCLNMFLLFTSKELTSHAFLITIHF